MDGPDDDVEGVEQLRKSENFQSLDLERGAILPDALLREPLLAGSHPLSARLAKTLRQPASATDTWMSKSRPIALQSGRPHHGQPGETLISSALSHPASRQHSIAAAHVEGGLFLTDLDYFEREIETCRQRLALNVDDEYDELLDESPKRSTGTTIERQTSAPLAPQPSRRRLAEDRHSSDALQDKLLNMEKDFAKAIDICQAMLVYSKEAHFQVIAHEQQYDALKQQNQDLQSRSSVDPGKNKKKMNREKIEKDMLELEHEVKRLTERLNQKEKHLE